MKSITPSGVTHIIIATGAFKHSLSASRVAHAIERGLRRSGLSATMERLPIADGGNGTLEAFLDNSWMNLRRVEVNVCDPLMRPIRSALAVQSGEKQGGLAVVEMAQASGLELLQTSELNPLKTSTYGTGELLRAALDSGAQKIIIGMGGSATVDGGAGCLQALGIEFYDAKGELIPPGIGGGRLHRIHSVDSSKLDPRWQKVEIILATDVDNPALGEQGAAAVFAPQKGANRAQVIFLEANLCHFFTILSDQLGVDVRSTPGAGAAGALAGGLMAIFRKQAVIQSGIDLILDSSNFNRHLKAGALVITGEGRMDDQTVYGKGPIGVARRAAQNGIKTVGLVGGLGTDDSILHDAGMWATLPIVTAPMLLDEAIQRADELVERAALRLGYLLQL